MQGAADGGRRRRVAAGFTLVLAASFGCDRIVHNAAADQPASNVRSPGQGKVVITRAACGSCHRIPGVFDADGMAGPPLHRFGRRAYIAGMLPNSPDNLVYWLRFPQNVVPGNAMPNTGLTEREARDAAAYLESLR